MKNILILLDVDGVLNPARGVNLSGAVRLTVSPARKDLVQQLSHLGDIVWCSSWQFAVLSSFGQELGVGLLDAVPLHDAANSGSKAGSIARWIAIRRDREQFPWHGLVWIDDSIASSDQVLLKDVGVPLLLLPTDPSIGLSSNDLDLVAEFANRLVVRRLDVDEM